MVSYAELFPETVTLNSGIVVRQRAMKGYWIDFHLAGDELVVTFENAGDGVGDGRIRDAWGMKFLAKRNYSILGVKWKTKDWYRGAPIREFFASQHFKQLSGRFSRTIFMGGSMGGYAALTFSSSVPGSIVLAHNPQSTLDRRLVPWDKRFPQAEPLDWDGDFADGAVGSRLAKKVFLTYDPYDKDDRNHADRISSDNVVRLHIPFVGHAVPVWLRDMRVLAKVTDLALRDELTPNLFAKLVRSRRNIPRYYIQLLARTKSQKIRAFLIDKALENTPIEVSIFCVAVSHFFRSGNTRRCIDLYNSHENDLVLVNEPRVGVARALIGQAIARGNASSCQINKILSLVDMYTASAEEASQSAMFLLDCGHIDVAYELAQRAITLRRKTRFSYKVKALCEARLHKNDEALETIKIGLQLFGPGDGLLKMLHNIEGRIADDQGMSSIKEGARIDVASGKADFGASAGNPGDI